MQYEVDLSAQAEADVREIYDYIRERGPANPGDWKAGLDRKLESLEMLPHSCGFAPENVYTQATIRQSLYGPFRILFVIRGEGVYVLTVRHGARRFMPADKLDQISEEE